MSRLFFSWGLVSSRVWVLINLSGKSNGSCDTLTDPEPHHRVRLKNVCVIVKTEKLTMEYREATVSRFDAKRLLPLWEFDELEDIRRTMNQGHGLTSWAESRYDQLLDKVRDEKGKEYAEMLAAEYREKLKEDEFKLVELSSGVAVSTYQEAIEFFIGAHPGFEKILRTHNPANWIPGCLPKIKAAAEGGVEGIFDYFMDEIENPDAFSYNKTIWPILIPVVNYVKEGIDCLEFEFKPYTVSVIKVLHTEHKKNFGAWVFTFPGSEKPVSQSTEVFDPGTLNISLPKITVPLKLLRGLASGDIQPGGCEVVKHKDGVFIYSVEGFGNEVTLSNNFMKFLMALGTNPLNRLQEIEMLDKITVKILETKHEERPIETPILREKDTEQLRIIAEAGSRSSWGGWGEALDMSRQGAKDQLLRFEERGLIELERPENGEIRAIMTPLGQACLV